MSGSSQTHKHFTQSWLQESKPRLNVHSPETRNLSLLSLHRRGQPLARHCRFTETKTIARCSGEGNFGSAQILLDRARATRNQAHLSLSDLDVSLYHSPLLSALKFRLLPERINEIPSVFHLKAYIFDDRLLVSGANLSKDYFTNRQDRYVVFDKVPNLCAHYIAVISALSSLSYCVQNSKLLPPPVDPLRSPSAWMELARSQLASVLGRPGLDATLETKLSQVLCSGFTAGPTGGSHSVSFNANRLPRPATR